LRTSSCTKAPVSVCTSHGAVVSQARRRTITSPARIASPGFSVRSREIPLRLFRRPITATRSPIGVVPGAMPLASSGISSRTGCGSAALPPSAAGWSPPPHAARKTSSGRNGAGCRKRIIYSGIQAS
jgi:hypothetical protein